MNLQALLPVVLNNQIVGQLKEGRAAAVEALVQFGVRPEWEIDEVQGQASGQNTRRTAWGWAHQAEQKGAVCAWWRWVHRYLEALSPGEAEQFLDRCFTQALDAAVPLGRTAVMVETWGRVHEWGPRLPLWSHRTMMQRAVPVFSQAGDRAVPCMDALAEAGFLKQGDWSLEARGRYPQDPMSRAIKDGQSALLEHLLAQGSPPVLLEGRSALGVVLLGETNISNHGEHQRMLASLLNHGAEWGLPLSSGAPMMQEVLCDTLAADGQDPLGLRPLDPSLAAAIAHRQLQGLVQVGPAAPRRRTRL